MFRRKNTSKAVVSQAPAKERGGLLADRESKAAVPFSAAAEEKKPIRYDAIVVGKGLAGLAAAVEITSAGKNVLVIEARSEANSTLRPLLIYLNDKGSSAIQQLYYDRWEDEDKNDKEFFSRVNTNERDHFGIKNIQRFLEHRIDTQYCSILYNTTVSAINMENGYVFTSDDPTSSHQKKFYFKNLVLADGAKHLTANLLYPHIQYVPTPGRPEVKHVIAYLTVKAKDDRPMEIPSWGTALLVDGNYCGLVYYDKHSFRKHKYTKMKFCVVMHVPDDLWEKFENRDLGIAYLKHCAASVFDEQHYTITMTASRIEKGGPEKDKLKYSRFSLEYFQAVHAAYQFYNRYRVYLTGDTRKKPDFYQGNGGNDAIVDGLLAGLCINGELSFSEYIERCEERAAIVSRKTQEFQPVNVFYKKTLRNFKVAPFVHHDEAAAIHPARVEAEMKEAEPLELKPLVNPPAPLSPQAPMSPQPHNPESRVRNDAGFTLFSRKAKVKPNNKGEASPCCVLS